MFEPSVGEALNIGGRLYGVAPHPAVPEMPYGQEGRQGIVYKLAGDNDARALKVFRPKFRLPSLVMVADHLNRLGGIPGLAAASRTVLTPEVHFEFLRDREDLVYAVLMPWIDGPSWMDVMLAGEPLTRGDSLKAARALAQTFSALEQRKLAHCDLSGGNLLLPCLAEDGALHPHPVELVDVEQMYIPGLPAPDSVASGTAGYAPHYLDDAGPWQPVADRFAGAVLLGEMLGWCREDVRGAAFGESYFGPDDFGQDADRTRILANALEQEWGVTVRRLFERAWTSRSLPECPTFGEWLTALLSLSEQAAVLVENNSRTEQMSPSIAQQIEGLRLLEERGHLEQALRGYQLLRGRLDPHSDWVPEIDAAIRALEAGPATQAPVAARNATREDREPAGGAAAPRLSPLDTRATTVKSRPSVWLYAGVAVTAIVVAWGVHGFGPSLGGPKSAAPAPNVVAQTPPPANVPATQSTVSDDPPAATKAQNQTGSNVVSAPEWVASLNEYAQIAAKVNWNGSPNDIYNALDAISGKISSDSSLGLNPATQRIALDVWSVHATCGQLRQEMDLGNTYLTHAALVNLHNAVDKSLQDIQTYESNSH